MTVPTLDWVSNMVTNPKILLLTTVGNRCLPNLLMISTSGMIPGIVASHMANVAHGTPTRNIPEHLSPQARVMPSHKWTGRMAGLPSMVNHSILRCVHHMGISMVLSIVRVRAKAKVMMDKIHTKEEKEKARETAKARVKARVKEKAKAREKAKAMRNAKGKDMAMPRATQKERAKVHMLQRTFACLWAGITSLQRPDTLWTANAMSGMMKSTMSGTMTVIMHTMYMPFRQNGIHMILMYGSTIHGNLPHAMGNSSPTLP